MQRPTLFALLLLLVVVASESLGARHESWASAPLLYFNRNGSVTRPATTDSYNSHENSAELSSSSSTSTTTSTTTTTESPATNITTSSEHLFSITSSAGFGHLPNDSIILNSTGVQANGNAIVTIEANTDFSCVCTKAGHSAGSKPKISTTLLMCFLLTLRSFIV